MEGAQRTKAGGGTPISEADPRSYVVLAPDDRKVLTDIARKVANGEVHPD